MKKKLCVLNCRQKLKHESITFYDWKLHVGGSLAQCLKRKLFCETPPPAEPMSSAKGRRDAVPFQFEHDIASSKFTGHIAAFCVYYK